jgi:hypothetical protein
MEGLSQAAKQIQSYGRGRDTMLAHIAPDEAQFIDAIQGGRRINPMTGLPEYGLFGKILKAVVRVGGAIGGFMIGGPAGAAAGSAAATKLTGGSWKDALKAGAMSGVGSYATQGLTGGGWNLTGAARGAGAAASPGAGSAVGDGASGIGAALSPTAQATAAGLPTGAPMGLGASLANAGAGSSALGTSPGLMSGMASLAPAAAPAASGLGATLAPIGGFAGAAAGLGGLSAPLSANRLGPSPSVPETSINLNVKPFNRGYRSPAVDLTNWAERPGGLQFFDEVNPEPEYLRQGGPVRRYNAGGGVMPMRQPGGGMGGMAGLRNPGIPSQIESPHFENPMAIRQQAMDNSPAAQRAKIRQAAVFGYMNAKDGGAIKGPGTETSDSIPAMLSDGEHVVDAATVRAAGGGNVDRGHKAIERFKQKARRAAGVKNPKKPPAFQGKK